MNHRQFYEKVKEMRQAQKMYFKTRRIDYLRLPKQLEREIDIEIKRVEKAVSAPGLFDLFQ